MDRETAIELLQNNQVSLENLDENLKDDPMVVFEACNMDASEMQFASDRLKRSKEFAMLMATYNLNILEYMDMSVRSDREVVLYTVEKNAYALEYASEDLKRDPVVQQKARQYLLPEIESHPTLIPMALRKLLSI